jgi:O-antigen/teichoic acid export membrane protein
MAGHGELLLRGSLLRTFLLIANIIVAFFLMPFVIHSVGDRWYGMWTLVGTLMGYYGYLDLGLSVSVQRFIARAIGKNDEAEVSRLFTTGLVLFVGLAIVVLVVSGIVALVAPRFFSNAEELNVFRIVVLILGVNTAVMFAAAPANGLFSGHLRYDVPTTVQLAMLVVRTALIVFFIRAGYSIVALALITFLTDTGGNLARVWLARRMFRHVRVSRAYYAPARLRELFSYGGKTFVNQLAELLRFQIDHVVIAAFINLSAVTVFNIASQLVFYFRALLQALVGVLVPLFARYQAEGDRSTMARAYLFTTKLAALVAMLGGGAMVIFGKPFIEVWMGPDYASAYPSLAFLAVATTLFVAAQPAVTVIYGVGAVGTLAKVSLVEASSNLILSVFLVRELGILGVALGTAIPLVFFSTFLILFGNRLAGTTVRIWLRSVGPVLGVTLVTQICTGYIVHRLAPAGYVDMIMLFLALYPAQALLALWLAFSPEEQKLIRGTTVRALGFG